MAPRFGAGPARYRYPSARKVPSRSRNLTVVSQACGVTPQTSPVGSMRVPADRPDHYPRRVATIAERILAALEQEGSLDDDELAVRLGVGRQSINPVVNRLAGRGDIGRFVGPAGKLLNTMPGASAESAPSATPVVAEPGDGLLSEDEVKMAVRDYLEGQGYAVKVAWGRARGIDLHARHPHRPTVVVEAKGEVASDQQQGSYFLGALGELVQRMDDAEAVYALALPDNRRYRGLVNRLPALARQRFDLRVYWVRRDTTDLRVEVDDG